MFITDAFEPLEGGAGGSWAHYWYYTLALWMCRCLLPTRFKAGLVGTDEDSSVVDADETFMIGYPSPEATYVRLYRPPPLGKTGE